MDGWKILGECAALVVRDARSRMEEKSEAGDDGPPARLAVARKRREEGAGQAEEADTNAGGERHAACPSERGGTSRTVTPSRVFATNDAARASERARAASSGKRA